MSAFILAIAATISSPIFEDDLDKAFGSLVTRDKVPSDDIKKSRVKTALEAFKNLSDYSKQARLLTDFTPNLILIAIQDRYNHTLQKALELEGGRNINIDRLDQVLRSLKGDKIFAGLLSGTLGNEKDLKQVLTKHAIELKTPNEAIDMVIAEVD